MPGGSPGVLLVMDTTGDLHLITPGEAIARRARGERLAFVDVRSAASVARSGCRVPGARWLEPGEAARDAAALPRDAVLVLYGEGARTARPQALADALRGRGLDARVLAGGFAAWSELRCPTELVGAHAPPGGARPRTSPGGRPALRLVFARP